MPLFIFLYISFFEHINKLFDDLFVAFLHDILHEKPQVPYKCVIYIYDIDCLVNVQRRKPQRIFS